MVMLDQERISALCNRYMNVAFSVQQNLDFMAYKLKTHFDDMKVLTISTKHWTNCVVRWPVSFYFQTYKQKTNTKVYFKMSTVVQYYIKNTGTTDLWCTGCKN